MRKKEVKLQYSSSFTNDYLYDFAKVEEFFSYNPYQTESYRARYEYLQQRQPVDRTAVAEALKQYNLQLGAGAKTMENIELLAQPECAAVITGQQAGILGGPLYTVYKALTAIQLAEKFSRELSKPVVPVFWIAAEDHDFVEINELHVPDQGGQPVRLKLEFEPDGKYSIGDIPIPQDAGALIDELAKITPDTEFKTELLANLGAGAQASSNLADWFGSILMKWLGSLGLIFVNPLDKRLRALERNLFRTALDLYPQVNEVLSVNAATLTNKGYSVAIEKQAENVNLFVYDSGERLALSQQGEAYILRGRNRALSKDELAQMIEEQPDSFSPNVVLRPLTQDILFPTLAYVGGPGEIGYFAQYKQVYEIFDLQMPIIYPRANISLIEGSVEKYMEKYQVSLEDVLFRADVIRESFLQEKDEVGIETVFSELQGNVAEAYGKALSKIAEVDSSLTKLGAENRDKVYAQIDWLKTKTLQAHRKTNDVFLRQFGKVCNGLAPKGQFQERYISTIYFGLKYGAELWQELAATPLLESTWHKVIYLKS